MAVALGPTCISFFSAPDAGTGIGRSQFVTPLRTVPDQNKPNGSDERSEPGRSPPVTLDSLSSGHVKKRKQHRRESALPDAGCTSAGTSSPAKEHFRTAGRRQRPYHPTCMNKGMLAPEELVVTDLHGRQLSGESQVFFRTGDASSVLSHATGRHGYLPWTSADGHRICGGRARVESMPCSRSHRRTWANSAGTVCDAGNSGIKRGYRTVCAALRRAGFSPTMAP